MKKGEVAPVRLPNLSQAGMGTSGLLESAWTAKDAAMRGFWRFGGNAASKVHFLSDRTFGTEIGAPVDPEAEPGRDNFISMLYAVRLPGNRALVLAPRMNDTEQDMDYLVVQPAPGTRLDQFEEFVGPSEEALEIPLAQQAGQSPADVLRSNISLFPFHPDRIEVLTEEPDRDAVYKEAVSHTLRRAMDSWTDVPSAPVTLLEFPNGDMKEAS